MQVGVVTNARSRRNRRLLPALREACGPQAGILPVELDGIGGLEEALREFAARDVSLIAVIGGDGTVQAVLTRLLSGDGCGFPEPPALSVLAGGTTNMTAADVGIHERPDRAVRRLSSTLKGGGDLPGEFLERHVVEVRRGDEHPLFGMFFGTGAICRAIQLARRSIHPMRLGSSLESALTLAGVFGERLFGRVREHPDRIMRGDQIAITLNDGVPVGGHTLLALSTTLHHLILRSRPFWGEGPGKLRFTRIAYPVPGFWRSVPTVMYGRDRNRLARSDYSSCNTDRVRLEMDCPFTLDGELFESDRSVPVELRGEKKIRFFRF